MYRSWHGMFARGDPLQETNSGTRGRCIELENHHAALQPSPSGGNSRRSHWPVHAPSPWLLPRRRHRPPEAPEVDPTPRWVRLPVLLQPEDLRAEARVAMLAVRHHPPHPRRSDYAENRCLAMPPPALAPKTHYQSRRPPRHHSRPPRPPGPEELPLPPLPLPAQAARHRQCPCRCWPSPSGRTQSPPSKFACRTNRRNLGRKPIAF